MTDEEMSKDLQHHSERPTQDYEEFEIGKHRVPWFLWVFFAIIISWASISWVKFFGY